MIGRGAVQFVSMTVALVSCLLACTLAQQTLAKFTIQIAAVPTEQEAETIAGRTRTAGIETALGYHEQPGREVVYRLQIGRFASRREAERAARELLRRGLITDFFITRAEEQKPISATERRDQTSRQDFAQKLEDDHSWTMIAYEPVASALREIALARLQAKIEIAGDVLRLVARSADAAAIAVRERSSGMVAFRSREAGYAYSRPRDWHESETTGEALREERIQSGELFIAPDATAFLSSGYRRFKADYDGYVPVSGLTPEVLIEKLMGKLRRLPGVHEARAIRHTETRKDGVERIEVELELSFRPAANEPAVPFVGQALVLHNARGVLELIGLRSRFGPASAARIIEKSISSAMLVGQDAILSHD